MISALALLLASSDSPVTAPTRETPRLETILEEANARWCELPVATTTYHVTTSKDGTFAMREVRDGERETLRFESGGLPVVQIFSDGKVLTALDLGARQYATGPVIDKTTRAERRAKLGPLEPLGPDGVDVRFFNQYGVVVRTDPPMPILTDENAMVDGVQVRRVIARLTKPHRDDERKGGTIEVTLLIDRKGGWLRRADVGYVPINGTEREMSLQFECVPSFPEDEAFTYDITRLKDWEKVDRLSIKF